VKTLSALILIALCVTLYINREIIFTSDPKESAVTPQPKPVSAVPSKVKSIDECLENGDFADALSLLDKKDIKQQNSDWMRKRVEALDGLGQRKEALKLVEILISKVNEGKRPDILWIKASILNDEGDKKNAGQVYYSIIEKFPNHGKALDAAIILNKIWKPWLKKSGKVADLPKYNKILAFIIENGYDEQLKKVAYENLKIINARLFFSPYKYEGIVDFHQIKHGDFLSVIAKKNKIYSERIARANGLKNVNDIKVNQSLRLILGKSEIKISKSKYSMHLYIGGLFFKHYQIGIGKNDLTPIVSTTISKSRAKKPTYTGPSGDMLENSHPDNPIGSRWLGFTMGQGLGIHGTREPDSIGKNMSNGCIRMHNRDVEEIYDYVMVGTEVVIDP